MFLYNRGYYGTIEGVNPNGVVVNAVSINHNQLTSRDAYDLPYVLLDPQFYLCSIDQVNCQTAFNKLISYPWVKTKVPKSRAVYKLSSSKAGACQVIDKPITTTSISECISNCLDSQRNYGATHLIIPTPMAVAREDQFSEQIEWLKIANSLKNNYKEPLLATIALSDKTLLDCPFESNPMIQAILDNVPLLNGIDGYYIVVQRDSQSIQVTEVNVARALLEFSYLLGEKEGRLVIINFADVFGYICLAAGATAFASGYMTKERRLSFGDFIERGGGFALPRYYSNTLIGDFYSERDLNKIANLGLLRYLLSDIVTPHSNPLIQALQQGKSADSLPAWKETRTNYAAAAKHRAECLARQTASLSSLPDISSRLNQAALWVQEAEAKLEYIKARLREIKSDPLDEDGRHLAVWRNAIDQFVKFNKL